MPFDGTTPDLTVPSLANLSYILRHPETWPENFKWDYRRFDSCAVGLASRRWGFGWACRGMIPVSIASGVGDFAFDNSMRAAQVTPEMVADAIDRL
jgi:hypothetical protein